MDQDTTLGEMREAALWGEGGSGEDSKILIS